MKEFIVIPPNKGRLAGLYDIGDAIRELRNFMYISDADKARAIQAYNSGGKYSFTFTYGYTVGQIEVDHA